jgi:hypothetical protein
LLRAVMAGLAIKLVIWDGLMGEILWGNIYKPPLY